MPAARTRSDDRVPARRPRRTAGVVLVALLLGLTAWSVAALQPPEPAPADAPATEFSAARAFSHVEELAAEVHVVGSPATDRVVDGLVATLTGLGLDTRVQNAVGAVRTASGETRMARVRNVVGVLPGTDPTGRLFLVAHHDSVETGPGAADDAAGVAAVLESVRALTAGPPLRNDVVVVLTDGEEACTCGAEAFAASHPLASGGGVVLNLEARGTGGPPIMFETSPGNRGLTEVYATAAPHPVATSFAVEVYRTMPHATDFGVLVADGGFTGLNTAFVDGAAGYHSPQDVPGRLDRGTLQALGDNALATARELGARDLAPLARPAAGDATYFPVPGGGLVRYPGDWVGPLAAVAVGAVALLVLVGHRRGTAPLGRTAAGAVLAAVPLVLAPLAGQGMWLLLVEVRPGYAQLVDPWRPGWFRLAVLALVAGVVLCWYALLRRRVGAVPLAVGGLVWLAGLAAVLAVVAPGGSYLAAWPALAGALAGLLGALTSARVVRLGAALLAGAVAVVVLAPTVALVLPALGLSAAAAPAAVATLVLLAVLPALELLFPDPEGPARPAVAVPAAALGVAVACTVAGLTVDQFDAAHPVPSRLAYVLDRDTGQASWVSTEQTPGEYTQNYVGSRFELPTRWPHLGGEVWSGRAEPADLAAAEVETVSDTVLGDRRELTVRITPRRPGVRMVVLDVRADGGTVVGGRIAGRDVPEAELGGDRAWIVFHAPPDGGLQASFSIQGGGMGEGAVDLRVVEGSDGLEGLPGHEPRPEGVDVAGAHGADLVLVAATTELG